jgi:hypothetical protein
MSLCSNVRNVYTHCILVSGHVFKGSWNKTTVALKVLVASSGATPSSTVRLPVLLFVFDM